MATKTPITPELLLQLLRYEPNTGKLFWLERTANLFRPGNNKSPTARAQAWNKVNAGNEALAFVNPISGYLHGMVFKRLVYAHRAAYMIALGEVPDEIDHINGDRTDNRLENLRAVDRKENTKNTRRVAFNTSGASGVHLDKRTAKWIAQINVDGRRRHLGVFLTRDDAVAARKAAETRFGYHPNHGRD